MDIVLSTIIPIYNKEKALRNTLQSIVNNHEIDDNVYECILIDDESTDSCPDICKEFCEKYPYFKYIRIFNDKVFNPSTARNFGLRLCKGKYIHFMDADDELCKTFYKDAIKVLDSSNVDAFLRGNYNLYMVDDKLKMAWFKPTTFKMGMYGPPLWSIVFKDYIKELEFLPVLSEDIIFSWMALNKRNYYDDSSNPNSIKYHKEFREVSQQATTGLKWPANVASILQKHEDYKYEVINGIVRDKYNANSVVTQAHETVTLNYNIFSNNCTSGFVYRDLGLKFQHPFVWSTLLYEDYDKLMDEYETIKFDDFEVVPTKYTEKIPLNEAKNTFTLLIDGGKIKVNYLHHHQDNRFNSVTVRGVDLYYNNMQQYVGDLYQKRVSRMLENGIKEPIFLLVKSGSYTDDEFTKLLYKPTKYKKIVGVTFDYKVDYSKVPYNTYLIPFEEDYMLGARFSNVLVKNFKNLLEVNEQ